MRATEGEEYYCVENEPIEYFSNTEYYIPGYLEADMLKAPIFVRTVWSVCNSAENCICRLVVTKAISFGN